jgi:hypothetical protein
MGILNFHRQGVISVNGKRVHSMEKESLKIKFLFMKENLWIQKEMDLENKNFKTETTTKVTL